MYTNLQEYKIFGILKQHNFLLVFFSFPLLLLLQCKHDSANKYRELNNWPQLLQHYPEQQWLSCIFGTLANGST